MTRESLYGPAAQTRYSPTAFFCLTVGLSLPFWIVGRLWAAQLLPGLPISSLMVICPVASAAILRFREASVPGVLDLMRRSCDIRRVRRAAWWVPILLLKPAVFLSTYGLLCLFSVSIPTPTIDGSAVLLLIAFLLAALGEELGWMGYAFDPLERRWGTIAAAVMLGLVWAVWHLIPFLQAERSLPWIAWQSLYLIGSRVLLVWIFRNAGRSVLAAALFHATGNLSWQLFPIEGSHYDPRVAGLLVAVLAVTAGVLLRRQEQHGHARIRRTSSEGA